MSSVTPGARAAAKSFLEAIGLLPVARRIATTLTAPETYRVHERRYRELKRQHAQVLGERLNNSQHKQKIALLCSPSFPEVEIELGLVKGLQLANFVPVVLITETGRERGCLPSIIELAAVDEIHSWQDFMDEVDSATAEAIVGRCSLSRTCSISNTPASVSAGLLFQPRSEASTRVPWICGLPRIDNCLWMRSIWTDMCQCGS